MPSFGVQILPLSFNSGCINFSDWIALLTVCLAPLIAHIASGAPTPTYLTDREPKWYDQLCIYNPTSIIWRYAAITDRRIRAKDWSRQDLAASNAIFWTSEGWDGREQMVSTTAQHCLRFPDTTYTRVFSLTMFKTIITTLQGVSAVYLLIGGLARSPLIHTSIGFGVDAIFFPLAILGLLRLSAGAWLTDDYIYQHRGLRRNASWELASPSALTFLNKDRQVNTTESRIGTESLLVTNFESAGFRSPRKSWGSFVFRICFLSIIWGVWLLALWLIVPLRGGRALYSVTYFLLSLFYLMFTTSTAVIYSFLFFRGRTTNTILPCISSIWYKLYTVLFSGLTIGLIVVASIETNKSPEGIWTSQKMPIDISCATRNEWWALPQGRHWLGFASSIKYRDNLITGNPTSLPVAGLNGTGIHSEQQFWLYNFTGYCLGHFENM